MYHYVTLRHIALHGVFHYVTLLYITSYCITLRYRSLYTLHYIALHYIALRYITQNIRLHNFALRFITSLYITAASRSTKSCQTRGHIALTDTSGYLSSLVSLDHGYETRDCPWQILVGHGQKIRILLVSFGELQPQQQQTWSSVAAVESDDIEGNQGVIGGVGGAMGVQTRGGEVCYEVGSAVEGATVGLLKACPGDLTTARAKTMMAAGTVGAETTAGVAATAAAGAASSDRYPVIHLSTGSNITVYLQSRQVLQSLPPFVLKYEGTSIPIIILTKLFSTHQGQ